MGVFLFAVGIGPLPGGFLAEYISLAAPFYAFALLGIGTTALAWFKIPETRAWRTAAGRAANESAPTKMAFGRQVRLLTAQRGFLLISIVSFTTFFARTGGLFNLIPTYAHDKLALSTAAIGTGLAMISIVGMLVAYPSGVLVDRFGRKAVIVPSTVFSNYAWFMLACAVWALSSGIAAAAPAAYAADMAPEGMNAPAMSTYRMLADFGYVAGPLLLGSTADLISTEAALYLTASLVITAGVVFAFFAPESYRRSYPPSPSRTRGDGAGAQVAGDG
jgi:MFS family permease